MPKKLRGRNFVVSSANIHSNHTPLMKSKLISLVRPLPPTALIAEQLEAIRATLYVASEGKALHETVEDTAPVPITCNWCGNWMPMPRQANIAIIDTYEALETTETLENPSIDMGLIMQYPEFVPAPQLFHIELVDIREQGARAKVPASSQPHIARARHYYYPTLDIQYPELLPAVKLHSVVIVPAVSMGPKTVRPFRTSSSPRCAAWRAK